METENKSESTYIPRPFLLTLFCVSGYIYFGLIFILLFILLLFNRWSTLILSDYYMESSISFPRVFIGGLLAFMLHGAALTGIMFIWQRKRYGLYIIGFSSLLIIVLSYVFGYGSLTGTLIYFSTFIIFLPFLKKLT